MLGVVSEQFPKGGALTLNTIAGVGMLAVGIIGSAFLGYQQDSKTTSELKIKNAALYEKTVGEAKTSVFGEYTPLDTDKVKALPEEEKKEIETVQTAAKKTALATVSILPVIMFVSYIGLILYFQSKGGYKAQVLISDKEEERLITGGSTGPAEF